MGASAQLHQTCDYRCVQAFCNHCEHTGTIAFFNHSAAITNSPCVRAVDLVMVFEVVQVVALVEVVSLSPSDVIEGASDCWCVWLFGRPIHLNP